MSVQNLVDSAIDSNTAVIFSKTWCPYSKKAKALFAEHYPEVQVKIFELDEEPQGEDIQKYLAEKTRQNTVPNVFINKKHIGGSSDLIALHENGGLKF